MVFIGIMGMDQRQKVVKDFQAFPCLNCKDEPRGKLVKVYSTFHIFFIPIFKWNEKYILLCGKCQHGFEVSKEKGKKVETGEETISYWDLKPLQPLQKTCVYCGHVLENNHKFCPECGKEVRT